MTNTTTDNEQSFEEWFKRSRSTNRKTSTEVWAKGAWDNRTAHYQKELAARNERIERLDAFGREFIYFEENSYEYKLMSEQLAEKDARIKDIEAVLTDIQKWQLNIKWVAQEQE